MRTEIDVEKLKQANRHLKAQYDEIKQENEFMKSSLSWKITAPIRSTAVRYECLKQKLTKVLLAVKRRVIYYTSTVSRTDNTFVLYRIIGNDLYPRHAKGQQYNNLKFILDHEADLKNCTKVFVVNRIIDTAEERKIIDLLEAKGYEYIHIPFIESEYRDIGFNTDWIPEGWFHSKDYLGMDPGTRSHALTSVYRHKNNYIMNNNGARNTALRDGKRRGARWILPWDGNCFVTETAWESICMHTEKGKYLKYFIVPMARETDNSNLLKDNYKPKPDSEPQIIFRTDSGAEFSDEHCYGRRPKVELLWHLGVDGDLWRNSKDYIWDVPRRPLSNEAGEYGYAGWVSRLYSGSADQEGEDNRSFQNRGMARNDAIIATISHVDHQIGDKVDCSKTLNYEGVVIEGEARSYHSSKSAGVGLLATTLRTGADDALGRGPYSVVDKTTAPPSGDMRDYWHISPYTWPNPNTEDGLPYVSRDGERAPGTRLYEPESEKYDRTRLQRVFDDSIVLMLAHKFTGEDKYSLHASAILDRFFVNDKTRMNPHLEYAQVWLGKNNNKGTGRGVIEFKDVYFYIDAVRMMRSAGSLSDSKLADFKVWLGQLLDWLISDNQGVRMELQSENNHGTFYDLTTASIAEFLGRDEVLIESLLRARGRIGQQFNPDGSQPEELRRTLSQHYCYFNMQAWLILAKLGSRHQVDIWGYVAPNGASLFKGVDWLLDQGVEWDHEQIDDFDIERIDQLVHQAVSLGYKPKDYTAKDKYKVKPVFFPHDGIRPYWNIGLSK